LAEKYPLTFLVAEDNKINRKLLVNMLGKLGYRDVFEAFDGKEAVRIMREIHASGRKAHNPSEKQRRKKVDVVLMDLWMPEMDGYEATEHILAMFQERSGPPQDHVAAPIVLAVSADVTNEAVDRATRSGMEGFMTKPYKLADLQRLIVEFCVKSEGVRGSC
jgi:CheY-like chemotaxis protein